MAIQNRSNYELKNGWMWRERNGNFILPQNMSTKHVFYVMKMIWNHACPKYMRIWDDHRYRFSDWYTKDYMLRAFHIMWDEAEHREDMGKRMKWAMEQIRTSVYLYQRYLESMENRKAVPYVENVSDMV